MEIEPVMEIEPELITPTSEISDSWISLTSTELAEVMPNLDLSRAINEITPTHYEHLEIVKKIAKKITNYIKITFDKLSFEHVHIILKMIMTQLLKVKLTGNEKKEITKLIMIYILDVFGVPHTASYYTVELIESLIELIYYHEIKKKKKICCF